MGALPSRSSTDHAAAARCSSLVSRPPAAADNVGRLAVTKARSSLFETESLAVLVHGIFAITMTLLILDLRIPAGGQGDLLVQLGELAPNLLAYAFGFAYLTANWLALRGIFRLLTGIDRAQTLLLLLAVSLMSLTPLTVALVAGAVHDSDDFGTAVRVLAGVVGAAYMAYTAFLFQVKRRGNAPLDQVGFDLASLGPVKALFLTSGPSFLALAVSFLTPWLSIGILAADLIVSLAFNVEQESPENADAGADLPL